MRIFLRVAVAAATVLASGALQAQKSMNLPVDRIVAVVGQHAILWSDVLEFPKIPPRSSPSPAPLSTRWSTSR
jgi:hypothetical protein